MFWLIISIEAIHLRAKASELSCLFFVNENWDKEIPQETEDDKYLDCDCNKCRALWPKWALDNEE